MNFNKDVAHIVYASDNRFAEILGVSLVSLYESSKDLGDILIYVLDSGIIDENKKKLVSTAYVYGRTPPCFIEAKDITKELQIDVSVDRGSLSQYARLFVSSALPDDLERVLYLDCDIVVTKSIGELWNLDLHDKTIGALMDAFSKYYRKNIDLEPNAIIFNSGVMLIDLKRWKNDRVEKKLLKIIADKNGQVQQGDQGVLNAVLSQDIYCFEPRFNSVTIFHDFTYEEMMIYRKPPTFYTKEQIKEAVDHPAIIHFTTSFISKRAWMSGCQHRYVDEWLKYKRLSLWKDTELWEDRSCIWKKIGMSIFKILPRTLAIRIAGAIQAYGRPIRNRLMRKK